MSNLNFTATLDDDSVYSVHVAPTEWRRNPYSVILHDTVFQTKFICSHSLPLCISVQILVIWGYKNKLDCFVLHAGCDATLLYREQDDSACLAIPKGKKK